MPLNWLPEAEDWKTRLAALPQTLAGTADEGGFFTTAAALARHRINFLQTNMLDDRLRRATAGRALPAGSGTPVRLAILSSCTMAHLHAAIRVAGLRRGLAVEIRAGEYGQYLQELSAPPAWLGEFQPTAVLLALDGHHLAAGVEASMGADAVDRALADVESRIFECWRLVRENFGCPVIHQLALPVHPELLGSNEHALAGSKADFLARLRADLRTKAAQHGVALLSLDRAIVRDGLAHWHDPALWHRAKQEISPAASPEYGDLLGRLLGALRGKSSKCLVLDLDNTLWGGVIGDDGLEGIVLGQGSALGEAFVSFQKYARELSRRGVILAVCSKNDEAVALAPFEHHPDMVLRRADISCFVANWTDKATNLRRIAEELNIGVDSLVFADDNPFERELVRRELPAVQVPVLGDDPTYYAEIIADAGYFEGLAVTGEDRDRTSLYRGNRQRDELRATATDLASYLRGLEMRLIWRPFNAVDLPRIVQLINKSNQFNLTTRRYTAEEAQAVAEDPRALGLGLRLIDRFGDNGLIAVVIARLDTVRLDTAGDAWIDTWLMSCRVLGRQVEAATLQVLAEAARGLGARHLIGEYIPSPKNAMVKDHYAGLGFVPLEADPAGRTTARLDLATYRPSETGIRIEKG